jgi:cytochrome c oxidase subunit 1
VTTTIAPRPAGGLYGWLAAADHKRIGLMAMAAGLVFFVVSGVNALLVRLELARPGEQFLSRDTFNEAFTMHGAGMVYLFVTPIALALGVYMVPLQLGAAQIIAPRLTLLGFWVYVLGGVIMQSSWLTADGPGKAGWTAYVPLADAVNTPGTGMDLWILGVLLATAGGLIFGATTLGTILRRRAPGMTMLRMPVFCWAMFVTCLMVVMTFPVLIVAESLLLAQRHGMDVFGGDGGPIAYQNLFWFYGHPVVYVWFFPFLGVVAEVVAVFSGRRFWGYRTLTFALLAFTALSMSVWAHHMFTTGQSNNKYFALTSTLLLVPAGIEYLGVGATMWRGSIRLTTPMLFALAFAIQFLIGGLTGIMLGAPALDYQLHDSYFVVAHFHYTAFGGALFGAFAAAYYWFPKMTGIMLRERLGKIHFALMVLGFNLTFFPMFISGWAGMPRRVADYPSIGVLEGANMASTVGGFVLTVAMLIFLWNLAVSVRERRVAPSDPWGGFTLEWATTSPPPRLNFVGALPRITSETPVLDQRIGPPVAEAKP